MKRALILLLLLAACQPMIECNEKMTCEDGTVYPTEQMIDGSCEKITYTNDPCKNTAECEKDEDCIPDEALVGVKYECIDGGCVKTPFGNPASQYCTENGGTLEMKETENGTIGMCTLSSGEVCEEWAYYRNECPVQTIEEKKPEGPCTATPTLYRADCCQKETPCGVTKIAVYNEDTGQCSCEPVEVKRQCAGDICEMGYFGIYDTNKGKCVCVAAGRVGETKMEYEGELTEEKARELIIQAFDQKWRVSGGCGHYDDGLQQPDAIELYQNKDGSWAADIFYYCGEYFRKPAQPDHHKEVLVKADGTITGLN